ncbi:hypothetical protein LOS78_05580 [Paracoccus sp. MA]|uniref:hypothetical protein n=1 Tax=Paracoccus sp. MA TaxID=2895796 RepID=UPI001E433238|nr:hypothetical protein [Paracoccus sp. MA]UFM63635.1 hypothetical protein LOS78_05580 [Paracoccus sp. MA]
MSAINRTIVVSEDSRYLTQRVTDLLEAMEGQMQIGPSRVTFNHVVRLTPGTAPVSPLNGDIYYDEATHKLRLRANGAWVDLN